jgi:GT2 family glycosyltransferase
MNNSPISYCIGTCNNLPYLQLAIQSVRKYSHFKNSPIIIFAENCDKDDTYKWLNENKEKYNLTIIIENNNSPKGIGQSMNVTANQVKTEYVLFLHSDMFISQNLDLECLKIFEKYPNEKLWVNPFRFQPNCWKENDRPGTNFFSYEHFGYKYDDFDEPFFIDYAEEFSKLNPNIEIPKGEGVSGLIRKSDWDNLGGCDPQFIAYYDDSDIFLRARLAGYKFVITTNAVVWHFGSRSDKSNFPTDEIIRSEKSKKYEMESSQKFYKKWGFLPINDQYGFVDFPSNIDKKKYESIIRIG